MNKSRVECASWNVHWWAEDLFKTAKSGDWKTFQRRLGDIKEEIENIEKELTVEDTGAR